MDLTTFTYEALDVRTVVIDGEPWFVAADVSGILGYSTTAAMTRSLDDDEKGVQILHTLGGDQSMTVINEAGLYSTILRSRVPGAKAFKRWVTHDVLPAIRKTGGYGQPRELTRLELIDMARESELARIEAEAKVEALAPSAAVWEHLASTACNDMSVRTVATTLARDPAITIGSQRLFRWLDEHRWTYRDHEGRKAYQSRIESGHLAHRMQSHIHPRTGETVIDAPQIRVTAKGLAALHKALDGSDPSVLVDPPVLPDMEVVS